MIKFLASPAQYKISGLVLLLAQLFLFIFCISPFQAGTWYSTEPAMAALFALVAMSSIWLALGIAKKWLALEMPIHPLMYGLLAWAGIQLATLFNNVNPLHSWMGIAQTGEGAAWQVMLAVMVFFMMPVWQVNKYRKIILSAGILSLCIMSYLHFTPALFCPLLAAPPNPDILPSGFGDYLPFIAGWLFVAYAASPHLRTPKIHIGIIFICCLSIFVSQSQSGRYIFCAIFLGAGIMLFLQAYKKQGALFRPGKTWKILAAIGVILPLFWTSVPLSGELLACNNTSVPIRKIINAISISTLEHEPLRLIAGNGWGSFKDDMYRYAMVDAVHAYKNGVFEPNFIWLNGQVFHPHNQPVAALLALGIFGLVIFTALPMLAILPLRKSLFWWCTPIVIGLSGLSAMWFTLPQVLPFQALGYAALSAGRKITSGKIKNVPNYFAVPCLMIAILLAASSAYQLSLISYGERLKNIISENPDKPEIVNWIGQDIPRGGERMTQAIQYFTYQIAVKASNNSISENDVKWFRNFMELAHIAAISPTATVEMVRLEPELALLLFRLPPSPLDQLKKQDNDQFLESLLRFTTKTPFREDFASLFLINLDSFTQGDAEKKRAILEAVLKAAPNHRSALWLLGSIYEENPAIATRGRDLKAKAARLGVERVYPVTRAELQPLLATP